MSAIEKDFHKSVVYLIQHFNMSFTRCHSVSLAFYLMLLLLVDLSVEPGLVIDHDLSHILILK